MVKPIRSKKEYKAALNRIYELGYRGDISLVDDNFIGNKRKLKDEILPAIIEWQKERKYPFHFITEVSINLADDEELMSLMVDAAVYSIFVGIETPNNESLDECGKTQNQIILNWLMNKGFVTLVKMSSIAHVKENLDAMDFEMSPEDHERINTFRPEGYATPKIDWTNAGDGKIDGDGVYVHQLANIFDDEYAKNHKN